LAQRLRRRKKSFYNIETRSSATCSADFGGGFWRRLLRGRRFFFFSRISVWQPCKKDFRLVQVGQKSCIVGENADRLATLQKIIVHIWKNNRSAGETDAHLATLPTIIGSFQVRPEPGNNNGEVSLYH
jgi:hypothetical protein